jgi:hypothetical protein
MNSSLTTIVCPHLGLVTDRSVARSEPDTGHRCYVQQPISAPEMVYQREHCLVSAHTGCPFYVAAEKSRIAAAPAPLPKPNPRARWLRLLPWIVIALLLLAVALVYSRDLLQSKTASTPLAAPTTALTPAGIGRSSTPAALQVKTPATAAVRTPARRATSTPEAGGRVLSLMPKAGDAGWWTSGEARGNHLGDSFLYSGYQDGQAFLSAVKFDARNVPRGAPVREASLVLTGLRDDRFNPEAGGNWSVQLLEAGAFPDFARTDVQTLLNAPAAVTLFPVLNPADLQSGRVNTFSLDQRARNWLAQKVADGETEVIARIIGPAGGSNTLFAWDSGSGAATTGEAPQLLLNLGPAPATPPPLPTQQFIVATMTPTPANILTVAAERVMATSVARTIGTYTPPPFRIVTPTPLPANMATVQAARLAQGLPPLVIHTAVPANAATATSYAAYATAVAVITGTFTPVPTNAVTPVMVIPTPMPENVATAAAQIAAATRGAAEHGTATPLPYPVLIASLTPSPFVVENTPAPANLGTAIAQSVYATAVAFVTGTFTPLPPNAMTATPAPPLPLLLYEDQMTPRPTPTATPVAPSSMPSALAGLVLFRSDREDAPGVYALHVPSGRVALVTQAWPYPLAVQSEPFSPDGRFRVFVRNVATEVTDHVTGYRDMVSSPQIFVEDREFKTERQLTTGTGWNYDPVWSPRGDRIAFVSTAPGNDEIFVINPDGTNMHRLTTNTWEWDKHPSWSPDGQEIVFYSNRDTGRRQLWIMNADGSKQRPLLVSPYNDSDPIWVK